MPDKLYKKVGSRYKPIGVEFTGFPADGIWLVQDGKRSCMIRLGAIQDSPKVQALPYAVLAEEFLEQMNFAEAASITDRVRQVAAFFAKKAEDV